MAFRKLWAAVNSFIQVNKDNIEIEHDPDGYIEINGKREVVLTTAIVAGTTETDQPEGTFVWTTHETGRNMTFRSDGALLQYDGAVSGVKASGTYTFSGNPVDGDVLQGILDDASVTFLDHPENSGEVQIGTRLEDTIDSLIAYLNDEYFLRTEFSRVGANVMKWTAPTAGTGYNGLILGYLAGTTAPVTFSNLDDDYGRSAGGVDGLEQTKAGIASPFSLGNFPFIDENFRLTNGSLVEGETIITAFKPFRLIALADGDAPNNALYYSITAGKLVYKDYGGVVQQLY